MLLPQRLMDSVLAAVRKNKGKDEICYDDWLKILEATKECLKPHLPTFANTPMGHVSLWGNEGRQSIEKDLSDAQQKSITFPLSTPGFWAENYSYCANVKLGHLFDTGTSIFWGITKKGEWAIVELAVQKLVLGKDASGETVRYQALEIKRARVSDPQEICRECDEYFSRMWDSIYLATGKWAERREELARQATGFHDSMECLDQIIRSFKK